MALRESWLCSRSGRSTVTFQYPKAALGKIFDSGGFLEVEERATDAFDVVGR